MRFAHTLFCCTIFCNGLFLLFIVTVSYNHDTVTINKRNSPLQKIVQQKRVCANLMYAF